MNKLKVCFLLKINEKGLHFDDEVKKVGNNMTSISFSVSHRMYVCMYVCSHHVVFRVIISYLI